MPAAWPPEREVSFLLIQADAASRHGLILALDHKQGEIMRNRLAVPVLTLAIATLAGCAGTIPVNYTPSNIVRYVGSAHVGDFSYQPAHPGKVATNQIQNTAIGKIFLPSSVSDLVRRATALELEKTGISIGAGDVQVSGDVLEFKADDLGYSVDWTYSVRYVITNRESGAELLNKIYEADPIRTGKFGVASDFSSSINDAILSGYSKFIGDPEARAILTGQ